MATLTYNFIPDSNVPVWVIDSACAPAIREGVIIRMKAEQLINANPTVKYDVRIGTDAGVKTFAEADVFSSLSAALAAYQALLS